MCTDLSTAPIRDREHRVRRCAGGFYSARDDAARRNALWEWLEEALGRPSGWRNASAPSTPARRWKRKRKTLLATAHC